MDRLLSGGVLLRMSCITEKSGDFSGGVPLFSFYTTMSVVISAPVSARTLRPFSPSMVSSMMKEMYIFFGLKLLTRLYAASEEVIVDKHYIVFGDGVCCHGNLVRSVFFLKFVLYDVAGEFAGFSCHYEACVQFGGYDGSEEEAAAFESYYFRYSFVLVEFAHFIAHDVQAFGLVEEGSDVLELYSRDGEIGDYSQVLL